MMLGVLFATLYASARSAWIPSAYAIADNRRKPVMREAVVPAAMTAVDLANPLADPTPISPGSRPSVGPGSDVGRSPVSASPTARTGAPTARAGRAQRRS